MDTNKTAQQQPRPGRGRLILQFLKGSKGFFILCMFCAALSALADMVTPQIIRVSVDNVLGNAPADQLSPPVRGLLDAFGGAEALRSRLWILALAVVLVAVVKAASLYGFRVTNARGGETLVKTMRDTLYRHIGRLPFQWHMQNHTGDIIQRCTSDVETIKIFVSEQLTSLLHVFVLIFMSLYFMVTIQPKLTAAAAIFIPIMIISSIIFYGLIGDEFEKVDSEEGHLSAIAQENLTGVRVVRTFGRERFER